MCEKIRVHQEEGFVFGEKNSYENFDTVKKKTIDMEIMKNNVAYLEE